MVAYRFVGNFLLFELIAIFRVCRDALESRCRRADVVSFTSQFHSEYDAPVGYLVLFASFAQGGSFRPGVPTDRLTFASLVMGILFLLIQTEGCIGWWKECGNRHRQVERVFVYTFSRGRPCIACSRRSHRIGVGGCEGDAQEV